MLNFIVDDSKCIRCGSCAAVCPAQIITMDDLPVINNPQHCLRCQHCLSVCPTAAVSIFGKDAEKSLPNGHVESASLKKLLMGRRSIRLYKPEPLPSALLDDLIDLAAHAPTGGNTLGVHFTVVQDPATMETVRKETYAQLATAFADPKHHKDPRCIYLKPYVEAYEKTGADRIFCNAPHLLVTSTLPCSLCPHEDALIAMSYFEIYAQSLNVGTLWNGLFVHALTHFAPALVATLNLPKDHTPAYAMSFGYPDVQFYRSVQRSPANFNYI